MLPHQQVLPLQVLCLILHQAQALVLSQRQQVLRHRDLEKKHFYDKDSIDRHQLMDIPIKDEVSQPFDGSIN